MSHKDDIMITLQEETSHAQTLQDILLLDVKYRGATGTSMEIQDHFRELKYNSVMDGLEKINMDSFAYRFYNYSMQGYCQIYLDKSCDERLKTNLDELASIYDLPVNQVEVDYRQDATVLCLGETPDIILKK